METLVACWKYTTTHQLIYHAKRMDLNSWQTQENICMNCIKNILIKYFLFLFFSTSELYKNILKTKWHESLPPCNDFCMRIIKTSPWAGKVISIDTFGSSAYTNNTSVSLSSNIKKIVFDLSRQNTQFNFIKFRN